MTSLEALGYVERRPDPTDRRAKRIHRTDRAHIASRAEYAATRRIDEELAELLGAGRIEELEEDLVRIIESRGGRSRHQADGARPPAASDQYLASGNCGALSRVLRLSGDVVTTLECEYSEEDRLLVGECWGTTTVRNEAGAWGGVFSGTTRVATDDVMESVWLGSGDYEGLRFVGSLVTATEPYVISGRVEPIAP